MGTGPFTFVEHVKGSHWVGKRFADYWDRGRPYLDGYRAIFIPNTAARIAAVRGERALIEFRAFNPSARDVLVGALGSKITVKESAWDCALWVVPHHEKKPWDDPRVRRALTLAVDRWSGSKALSRITIVKEVGGVQVPGTTYAATEAELRRLARRRGGCCARPTCPRDSRSCSTTATCPSRTSRSPSGSWTSGRRSDSTRACACWRAPPGSTRCAAATSRSAWTGSAATSSSPTSISTSSCLPIAPTPATAASPTARSTRCTTGRPARATSTSVGGSSASSRDACSTSRRTSSRRSGGTGSSRTTRACAASRSRRAISSTASSTRSGWRSETMRVLTALALVALAFASPASAQDKPRYGGELIFLVPSEPPSYDGHKEGTFGVVHPLAPHYNTLLRIDPTDRTGTRPVPDLAESWTISPDGLVYTLRLRQGVRFHDGSPMTSRDVKASYDKIVFPPAETSSYRKGQYRAVEAIEAPDASTIRFRLKWPEASFLMTLASPYGWIYKADILAKDIRWYEKNVMGTGPFTFVEHVKGSHWIGKKNPNYWDKGKPYLDGFRALFISSSSAQVAAIRGERAHIQFRSFSPAERDTLVAALGLKITVQESPWDCSMLVAMNHERKPWDDKRARRALTLALDRYEGAKNLSRIAVVKDVGGIQVPGTPWATPPPELEKLAGYGRDIKPSRAEARRLLREVGVPDGFAFTFKNRGIPQPYEPLGIWLIDQWRQIGLNVRQEIIEASAYHPMLQRGDFDVAMDFQCSFVVEPDMDIDKFQSMGISDRNFGRYKDPVLDDLFVKQARALDPEERKRHLRAFEKRLLDEEVHYFYTLQNHRIIPHSARVRGWTITPSHFLNQQLDTVWLAE